MRFFNGMENFSERLGVDSDNLSVDSIGCSNCNKTFLSDALLDCHTRTCRITNLTFDSGQNNFEIKDEPDMDIAETHVSMNSDNGCFEFIGQFDSYGENIDIKAEQDVDSDHDCFKSITDFNGSTKWDKCNNSSSADSSSEQIKNNKMEVKRRRQSKTSSAQYEEYLNIMENDPIFRSGTINPGVSSKYMSEKWEELSKKLNSSGNGPILLGTEWKKRFNDWKNGTKAKYRKILEVANRTGSAPFQQIQLTSFEKRGLVVWSKVAVKGSPGVPVSGGINKTLDDELPNAELPVEETEKVLEVVEPEVSTVKNNINNIKNVSEELLTVYKESEDDIEKRKLELQEKEYLLKVTMFKFELEKYKYEHPNFKFDHDL